MALKTMGYKDSPKKKLSTGRHIHGKFVSKYKLQNYWRVSHKRQSLPSHIKILLTFFQPNNNNGLIETLLINATV